MAKRISKSCYLPAAHSMHSNPILRGLEEIWGQVRGDVGGHAFRIGPGPWVIGNPLVLLDALI